MGRVRFTNKTAFYSAGTFGLIDPFDLMSGAG
jgi:hypothetical protein